MSVSVRVSCPSCRIVCLVAREHVGSPVRCPGCKKSFAVRLPEAAPAAAPPPATDPEVDFDLPPVPPAPAPTVPLRLDVGCATSPGRVRERNEDSVLAAHFAWAGQPGRREAALLVVADGMGGHEAGDRASAIAIGAVAAALGPRLSGLVAGDADLSDEQAHLDAVDHALWEANRAVLQTGEQEPACSGMGSTAVAALVIGRRAAICHVGDCRAYLVRGGKVEQLTRDHTLVERMIQLGTLTEKEAKAHPASSQVTQALGKQYDLEPSRKAVELQPGDCLVLACDGLHAHLEREDIARAVAEATAAAPLAETLVARTNQAGGSDNCTVIALRCA